MPVSLGKVVAEEFPWGDINPKALDMSPGALQCTEAELCWPLTLKAAWVAAEAWQPCLAHLACELCCPLLVNFLFTYLHNIVFMSKTK